MVMGKPSYNDTSNLIPLVPVPNIPPPSSPSSPSPALNLTTNKRIEPPVLYNLTLHHQSELAAQLAPKWDVEVPPRMKPLEDPHNFHEIKTSIRRAISSIPPGSSVLIGGITQVCALILELKMFSIYYVKLRSHAGRLVPYDVTAHVGWSRAELHEMRDEMRNDVRH